VTAYGAWPLPEGVRDFGDGPCLNKDSLTELMTPTRRYADTPLRRYGFASLFHQFEQFAYRAPTSDRADRPQL
jgi:hypothetical protein